MDLYWYLVAWYDIFNTFAFVAMGLLMTLGGMCLIMYLYEKQPTIKAYAFYFTYLLKHKYHVFRACCKLGIPLRGLVHDLSKFNPLEFFYCAPYFYAKWKNKVAYVPHHPQKTPAPNEKYDLFWIKHKNKTKHHWQYWVSINDKGEIFSIPMSYKYVKEMVCDWYGANKVQKNTIDIDSWFELHKNVLYIDKQTEHYIYKALSELKAKRYYSNIHFS